MASREEIFERAKKAVIAFDGCMAKEVAAQGLAEGIDPIELMTKGFVSGINEVGNLIYKMTLC